jgi:integrase/recombinase XerD
MSTELATYSQAGALEALTLSETIRDKWLTSLENENTRAAYRRDLEHFAKWCATQGGEPITAGREAIDTYVISLKTAGLSKPTIVRRLAALSSFYEYAIDRGDIAANPTVRVKRPKWSKTSPTLGMDKAQAVAFLEVAEKAGPRDYALACLLILNGLRVSEALAINLEGIYSERGHHVVEVIGKGDKSRNVPLDPRTVHAIELAGEGREAGPILTDSEGERLNRYQAARIVTRLARAAGIPKPERITPHSCRHTFVTLSLDAGVPLHKVQDAAGHGSPETTIGYDRARGALEGAATYRLAAFLGE